MESPWTSYLVVFFINDYIVYFFIPTLGLISDTEAFFIKGYCIIKFTYSKQ